MTLQGSQPLAMVSRTTYTLDGGVNVSSPVLPAPPAGAALDVGLSSQQIRTLELTYSRSRARQQQ